MVTEELWQIKAAQLDIHMGMWNGIHHIEHIETQMHCHSHVLLIKGLQR